MGRIDVLFSNGDTAVVTEWVESQLLAPVGDVTDKALFRHRPVSVRQGNTELQQAQYCAGKVKKDGTTVFIYNKWFQK